MDMLYVKYASPKELIQTYIEQSRFGEFVSNFLRLDQEKCRMEAEQENDRRLWIAYVHSMTDKNFHDWKEDLKMKISPVSYEMTDKQVKDTVKLSRNILSRAVIR